MTTHVIINLFIKSINLKRLLIRKEDVIMRTAGNKKLKGMEKKHEASYVVEEAAHAAEEKKGKKK